jgi:hypothetical protein
VVLVVRSVQPQPVMLSFVRPQRETMRAAGGPLASCRTTADSVSNEMRAEEHKEQAQAAAVQAGSGSGSASKPKK